MRDVTVVILNSLRIKCHIRRHLNLYIYLLIAITNLYRVNRDNNAINLQT